MNSSSSSSSSRSNSVNSSGSGFSKSDCMFEGRSYHDGSELCSTDGCMKCNNGEWEDLDVSSCC